MKNLPKIHIWREMIEPGVFAYNAVRGWQEPSNGVFILAAMPERGYFTYQEREEIGAELARRLRNREHQLVAWYGRHWRHHMTDRISADGRCSGNPL
jgi:hypothetical protein